MVQATRQPTYPVEMKLDEGHALVLRPMTAEDREGVLEFARSLPPHDLLFLRRDITDPEQVDAWIDDIRRGMYHTILAVLDGEVVGYGSVAKREISWMRHVAELRVLVSPKLRGRGLGRVLTTEAFEIASHLGVTKMVAHMTSDQKGAMKVFKALNFEEEAILRHEVMDRDGKHHDLVVMRHDVEAFREKQSKREAIWEAMSRSWDPFLT